MFLVDLINKLIPTYYSQLDQIRAMTIIATSFAMGGAMLLLVLYWVATKSFETKTTLFVALAIILGLGACVGLVIQGQLTVGTWIFIILMVLVNFANMSLYGISSSSSAAYTIPILLAMFCIGTNAGFGITILGCIFVFLVPTLQSRGMIKSILPFHISSLTFDAPVLALIYLLVAIIVSSWAVSATSLLLNS